MNAPSISTGWRRWVLVAAIALWVSLSMSAKALSGAHARGWRGAVTFRQATVDSVQVMAVERNDRRIAVEWTLEGELGAHGTAFIELDDDDPIPRRIPVAFDPNRRRWYARDAIGTDKGSVLLDFSVAGIALGIATWAAIMATIRRAANKASTRANVDRDALASVVGEQQGSPLFLAIRISAALALYLGLHFVSLAMLALAGGLMWLMVQAGRFNLALVGVSCVVVFAVGRVYLTFASAQPGAIAGPRLLRDEHPAFFAELDALAARCNTAAPDEVILEDSHNAAVIEDSRWLGLVSGKRTLILGLSLLRTTSVSELRAVIAHEFGHFVGGDTRLGAVLFAIRSKAIDLVRSITETQKQAQTLDVSKPYLWYLELFLFVTRSLSRTQELLADKLSVAVAGRDPHINELKKSAKNIIASNQFWHAHVVPVINAGMLPSDLDRQEAAFAEQPADAATQHAIERAMLSAPSNPFDTHPSLAERIAFAEMLDSPAVAQDDRPALSLFDEARAERAVAEARHALIEARVGASLESVTMEQALARMSTATAEAPAAEMSA